MAHEIQQMAFVGEVPWHGLGNKLTEGQVFTDYGCNRLSTATQNSGVPIKAMPMQCREASMASVGLPKQNGH